MTLKGRRIPCASLLVSAAAAFLFWIPSLAASLQYDRAAIAAGEIWRLLSGHWTHYSLDHLLWDVLAFSFLGFACERRSRSRFLACVMTSALAISGVVWFCLPDMILYRGLSGVDSALYALLVADLWLAGVRSDDRKQLMVAAACAAGLVLKIGAELVTGDNLFVANLSAGPVPVPLAHVAGAATGCLVGLESALRRSTNVIRSREASLC